MLFCSEWIVLHEDFPTIVGGQQSNESSEIEGIINNPKWPR